MAQGERHELVRALSMKDILALAFGTMVGWGWIMLAGKWVALAGVWGAIIAFAIGAVLCIFVGLTYAELTPALPLAGGELVFSYRGLGYHASWLTGWMITFAYVGVAAWEGPAMATAIDYLIPLPRFGFLWNVAGFDVYLSWVLVGSLGGLFLAIVNYRGVKSSAIFQLTATTAMAIGGVCFLFGGAINGDFANMIPPITTTSGLVAVILMVPAMFVGFDVIPQAAEEMQIPLNKIAGVLILSICLAAAWYMLMIVGIALSAPPDVRAGAAIPVADSFAYCMGSPVFGKLMIITALCGILTSWNGFIVGATRVLFGMGRAKMLPEIFGKVHPQYHTPYAAIILVGIITCSSPLLGKTSLVWFVDASAFGTVVAYFMVACSFLALRKKEPDLVRPYKVKNGVLIGWLAIGVAAFFLYLYLPIGPGALVWQEWWMVFGWVILGVVFFFMAQAKYGNVSLAEREYLMFGAEYSRADRK
ncbi:Amino acid permease-associated region [uncultured delta proteobacterium]|uniref:Amino acid permease-associated region n=1 Tax=uncultured delta proteobacterium TaxID=34034 RepID=A0A212IWP4_9DELT|nr:Amino acid permease-associated region [uncultured delta proteobacterium]